MSVGSFWYCKSLYLFLRYKVLSNFLPLSHCLQVATCLQSIQPSKVLSGKSVAIHVENNIP